MVSPFDVLSKDSVQDVKKLNQLAYPVEGEEDPLKKINEGIEANIRDLEGRYAQPNWFKVAAGFAKPQLGGFMASLGSASEALGENFEQQRALQVPLFKMRTELATNAAILNRNKTINDKIAAYKAQNKNLPPPELLAEWEAQASEASGTKAMSGMAKTSHEQQTLAAQQNQIALSKISEQRQIADKRHQLGQLSDDEYKAIYNELDKRASALNSPSDVTSTTNYTPTPTKVSGGNEIMPSGVPLPPITNKDLNQSVIAPRQNPLSSMVGGKNAQQPEEPYNHVVQAIRPSGEPESVFKSLQEQRAATARSEEERTNAQLTPYYLANDHAINTNYNKAAKELLDLSKSDKDGFAAVHNLIREGGPLAAAAQKGLVAHFGNINANLSLPVEEYKRAGLPKQYWGLADRLLSDYSVLANIHMKLDGHDKFDPTDKSDMGKLVRYANLNRTPDEAIYTVKDNRADFDMQARIGQEIPRLMSKIQAEHRDELAPKTAAFRHKEIQNLRKLYADERDLEQRKYQAARQKFLREHPNQ